MEYTVEGLYGYLYDVQNLFQYLTDKYQDDLSLISFLESKATKNYYVSNYFATLKGFVVATDALSLPGDREFVIFIYLQDGRHSYFYWDKQYYSKMKKAEDGLVSLLRYAPLFMHLTSSRLK